MRYLQRLFEAEGTIFTDFLLHARLTFALMNPRAAILKISAIAIEAGFGSLSCFNEAFRRRYGLSPSELRSQARHRS